jgi:hypothetical protein
MVGDGSGGSDEEQSVASTRPHFRLKQGTGHLKKSQLFRCLRVVHKLRHAVPPPLSPQ